MSRAIGWVQSLSQNRNVYRNHFYILLNLRNNWATAHATILIQLRAGDSVKVERIWGGTSSDTGMNYFYGYLIEET